MDNFPKPSNVYERDFIRAKDNIPTKEIPPLIEAREEMKVYKGISSLEYAERLEFESSKEVREIFEKMLEICEAIKEAGGLALLVGGTVRDEIRGSISRDFDVEVYGLEAEKIEEIVSKFGNVNEVGKAFGILKICHENGFDIDISLPRNDSKVEESSNSFNDKGNPNMSVKEAARRRDFTFNTLAKDPLTGEIFDAFNGIEDLKNRTLRVTDPELFKDDPLRVMRGAQFAARMGLRIDPDTMTLMQSLVPEMKALPPERMQKEWNKLLSKPERPSLGLQTLFNIGVIHELYPELAALEETPQEFDWHPEGDVWVHTLMVVDSARDVVRAHNLDEKTANIVMLASLCHDLGKPITTEYVDGKIRARAHDVKGEKPTRVFLEKIGESKKTTEKVVQLVRDHLTPHIMYLNQKNSGSTVTDGTIRRLANRLHPATIAECTYVAEADCLGRGPFLDAAHADQFLLPVVSEAFSSFPGGAWARERAVQLEIIDSKPDTLIHGKELIAIGFKPGIPLGMLIRAADSLRDSEGWNHQKVIEIIVKNKGSVYSALHEIHSYLKEEELGKLIPRIPMAILKKVAPNLESMKDHNDDEIMKEILKAHGSIYKAMHEIFYQISEQRTK